MKEEFKKLRERAGITQEKCADMLGVTRETVSRWERGKIPIKLVYFTSLQNMVNKL